MVETVKQNKLVDTWFATHDVKLDFRPSTTLDVYYPGYAVEWIVDGVPYKEYGVYGLIVGWLTEQGFNYGWQGVVGKVRKYSDRTYKQAVANDMLKKRKSGPKTVQVTSAGNSIVVPLDQTSNGQVSID